LHARRDCGSFEVRASFFFLATCAGDAASSQIWMAASTHGQQKWGVRSTNEDLAAQTANHMKGGL
jgi:hypothetical protein